MGLAGNTNRPVTRFNSLRVAQSILGTTLPILIGQQRLPWKLLWYGAFSSKKAQQQGGSGLSKGGIQYVYSASVVGSICLGNCVNFLSVWDSIGRYAMDSVSETTTLPGGGSIIYAPTKQSSFKQDLGVGLQTPYSFNTNDYGSPGSLALSGNQQSPLVYTTSLTPGLGQYTITSSPMPPGSGTSGGGISTFVITSVANASGGNTIYTGTITGGAASAYASYIFTIKGSNFPANNGTFACVASTATTLTLVNATGVADTAVIQATIIGGVPVYVFNAAQAGAQVTVNYVAYRYRIQEDELDVAASTVTVQYQANFYSDVGVKFYPQGTALTFASGASSPGTYDPNGGNYKFNAADFGKGVVISYSFSDPNQDNNAPSIINLTFFSGALGQTPWSYLSSKFPSSAIGYSETAYMASSGLYLGFSPVLPQYNFEILGPYSFGNGIPDANPADAIYGLLTAPIYKLNFPFTNIDSSLLGNYSIAGSVTSGPFTSGEILKQTGTGALALLIGTVTGSNPMIVGTIFGHVNATGTWVGQTSAAIFTPTAPPASSSVKAMWTTNNFFISDILDNQTSLMGTISKWCEAGQVFISYDEGILKFTPLVDTTTVGNGLVYNPPTQPVIDLDYNDFVVEPNKDPIEVSESPWQNRWNRIQIRWDVRSNDYNSDIYQVQDEGSIQTPGIGLMTETAQDYAFITTLNAAQFAGTMRLQRYSAIFTTYKFTLKANLAFLSPGDIVTITDGLLNTQGGQFGRTPCRIVKMTDDPIKGVIIEAENFPWSVGAALLYNAQAQLPSNTNDGPQEDPGNTTALIFEVPSRAAQHTGGKLYIFGNGSNSNWGGFELYVSFNGTDYAFYGQYDTPARIGTTTADFPLHSDPDNTDTLSVNMQQSGATLQSVTSADNDAFVTLSALISVGSSSPVGPITAGTGINLGTPSTGGVTSGSQGPLLTTKGVDAVAPPFTPVWITPNNVTGASGYATTNIDGTTTNTQNSHFLNCTKFGFSIPAIGIGPIVGLQVICQTYVSAFTGTPTPALNAQLMYNGAAIGSGVNVFPGTAPPTPSSPTTLTTGQSTTLINWGFAPGDLTASIVNDPSFGVQFQAVTGSPGGGNTATVDVNNVQITLTWASAGSALVWTNPQNVSSASSYATTSTLTAAGLTVFLAAINFNFAIPFGFTLGGVKVVVGVSMVIGFLAEITVSLAFGGVRIGLPKVVPYNGSPADFTFGSATDLWGLSTPLNSEQLNTQGTEGFSIQISMSGQASTSFSCRNVRVTLTPANTGQQLELISYQTATLTGENTYALTNIHRGVYGSTPCDHPQSSTFARMDQATLTYTVDPTYYGVPLYFKFLSFNAYGNQLQTLSSVSPYVVTMLGLPGAIDLVTGALRTGTPNFNILEMEAAFSALHGPFGVQNVPSGYTLVGSVQGIPQWKSLSGDTTGSAPGVNDMYIYVPLIAGTYGPSQELYFSQPVRNLTLPASLVKSNGGCRAAPTNSVQVSLNKNGIQFGTINIAGGATVATVTMASSVSFNGTTDTFNITAPAVVDKTFAGFWLDIYASRSN